VIAFVTAGAGFLLAVLWFDLMFDVQVLGRGESELPEELLASIAGYYRRVTTAARPMNRLIAAVMLATIAAIVAEILNGDVPPSVAWASLILAAAPILLAGVRTVPSAVRLGTRGDALDRQSALARSICREHLVCLAAIAALLAVQLAWA
jgi:hypothetical protein